MWAKIIMPHWFVESPNDKTDVAALAEWLQAGIDKNKEMWRQQRIESLALAQTARVL